MASKSDLLALVQQLADGINAIPDAPVVSPDPMQQQLDDANAKIADLQGKLDQANLALQAEIAHDQEDVAKAVALQGKIDAALAALAPAAPSA